MTDHEAFNAIVGPEGQKWPPCLTCGKPDALVRWVATIDAEPKFYCGPCAANRNADDG
jgi:hypothetical protein